MTHSQHYSSSTRQYELLHSFMKRTCQVVRQSELNQLFDAIIGYTNLNERILKLENLKADIVKDPKGFIYMPISDMHLLAILPDDFIGNVGKGSVNASKIAQIFQDLRAY
ncbi:unnamed protein product [Brugia timori]|uniref:Transposase n=1 Tax=Brugia timori TaxID=42155 RepID=A0A0R3R7R3_9BILA|nr:unnamed protein product [Brugia timori]